MPQVKAEDFKAVLEIKGEKYQYSSLRKAENSFKGISKLPYCLKVLLENMLRNIDGTTVTENDINKFSRWLSNGGSNKSEISFQPARVLMQDFTGVPAIVDLAAMRDAIHDLGGNPSKINPLSPVDLVIDHSVMVDAYANKMALNKNVELEFKRNTERYTFLKWGQESFSNFRVVPPGKGICHQINIEYLAKVVWSNNGFIYPDTVIGTDSHTTMVNSLGVLGWGVGGIEAEAAMLGQPISMLIPDVIGVNLTGSLKDGVTATDVVLLITEILRKKGVVEKFVEYFGSGLVTLPLADRATIANMAPEYGATCGVFPVDSETTKYLKLTGRTEVQIKLVEEYMKQQGMWGGNDEAVYTDIVNINLDDIVPCVAGPKRPQDRVKLPKVEATMQKVIEIAKSSSTSITNGKVKPVKNGDVVIAAITSCTNTSNPSVMITAGLVARKARELGLESMPWVKTSLAPGSQVVSDYLKASGLDKDLDELGFNLVGYGCTTCIGNSGPLSQEIEAEIKTHNLSVAAVLSGNRNFEGRVHSLVKASFLASPPLVVVFALVGTVLMNIETDIIGTSKDGKEVKLQDIWPDNAEVKSFLDKYLKSNIFTNRYQDVFTGSKEWQELKVEKDKRYNWSAVSTYVQKPPYFKGMPAEPQPIKDINKARMLLKLGDSITTDHISPAGSFSTSSATGKFLQQRQISPAEYNSYGSRRGNHQVMMRGTFANIRIRNELVQGSEGGVSVHIPTGDEMSVYDVAMRYKYEQTPLIVIAGKEYGTGSSRDWAAKGTLLLGVKAVIVESFERIHRSNLIGMGILPLQFVKEDTRLSLKLDGSETFDIIGINDSLKPRSDLVMKINRKNNSTVSIQLLCRIDTENELKYYKNGGVLNYVLRRIAKNS